MIDQETQRKAQKQEYFSLSQGSMETVKQQTPGMFLSNL